MEKIQLITNNSSKFVNYPKEIVINNFNKLKALDDYDINIFDLNNSDMWQNKVTTDRNPALETIMTDDFKSINQMIFNSKMAVNIICLPQNINYHWNCYSEKFNRQLKDMIPFLLQIIKQLISIDNLQITYENSSTSIKSNDVTASFFINAPDYSILTSSNNSNKTTTIRKERLIITSLDIITDDYTKLLDYLSEIELIKKEIEFPDWLYKYSFNDDDIQKNNIEQAKEQIKIQKEMIENANNKLLENLHFKSILYNNSDQLVDVVFEILQYIFDISLSDFNDEKREDFLFKRDDITYIGEIKGVTSNVKYEHISQLEVHYSKYLDYLQENNLDENIKKLLIINYERNKDILLRDEVNQMQIDLAKKNETLIIDTKSLLTIYEKLLDGSIVKSDVIDLIKCNIGLIDIKKIIK